MKGLAENRKTLESFDDFANLSKEELGRMSVGNFLPMFFALFQEVKQLRTEMEACSDLD